MQIAITYEMQSHLTFWKIQLKIGAHRTHATPRLGITGLSLTFKLIVVMSLVLRLKFSAATNLRLKFSPAET